MHSSVHDLMNSTVDHRVQLPLVLVSIRTRRIVWYRDYTGLHPPLQLTSKQHKCNIDSQVGPKEALCETEELLLVELLPATLHCVSIYYCTGDVCSIAIHQVSLDMRVPSMPYLHVVSGRIREYITYGVGYRHAIDKL